MSQNDRERIKDKHERGLLTTDEANVEIVRAERICVVSKLTREVRSAYNKAVKIGYLGHMKKDGIKPEVYFHPEFKYMAIEVRNKRVTNTINCLTKCCI